MLRQIVNKMHSDNFAWKMFYKNVETSLNFKIDSLDMICTEYESWLKSSLTDQDTLKEYKQMRFIFQYSPLCSSYSSCTGIAVIGSH